MAAKFEVKANGSGFQWVLSSQGRTLAIGPTYARKALAQKSIDAFRTAAVAAPVDDQAPTRRKTAPAKATPVKAARAAKRRVGKVVAEPMDQIEQGLAKLDTTVAEIKKVVGRTGKRVARTTTGAVKPARTARTRAAKG